jgi:hypothetical protein
MSGASHVSMVNLSGKTNINHKSHVGENHLLKLVDTPRVAAGIIDNFLY